MRLFFCPIKGNTKCHEGFRPSAEGKLRPYASVSEW
jgi:hypothetical protein